MKNSREKGARFERALAKIFTNEGYPSDRTAQHCGKTGDAPDVIGLPFIHVEAKHYAKQAFSYDWIDQAKRDCKEGKLPAVFHKTDYHEILVTMTLNDWFEIYREYEAGMSMPADIPFFSGMDEAVKEFEETTKDLRKRGD